MKKITLAIEWDIDEEVFVVKKPKSHLGGTIKLIVKPQNFQQINDPDDKNCLYYDVETGLRFKTIGEGIWYNQGLLYFLLLKYKNKTI